MQQRALTPHLTVPAIGLGTMGMTGGYGVEDEAACEATVRAALDAGVALVDTAHFYGDGRGERLIGRALGDRRDEAVLMVKTGIRPDPDAGGMKLDGRPEFLRRSVDESLRRLGTDRLDVSCLAWVDRDVPVEESVGALGELVTAGKVRHLALSEAAPATLRRAIAAHPVALLVTEYSLWTRHVEEHILDVLADLGVGLVAYAPLGRGFLTGTVRGLAHLDEGDWRNNFPRFADGNIERNLELLAPLRAVAGRHGTSPAVVALAWVLSRGPAIVALAGCKTPEHIREDATAAGLRLTADDLAELEQAFPAGQLAGERYGELVTMLIDA
ncbi:aldo/keto reductase [Dactylosporangium sp. AC04546]|uniref:aldo/keto reductase n=1 Tax=Dactylosporangium sp. AC04546 TaxID=2862460 RepID=UPI001EE07684|nr:aldo/keto reductase [Dactylosporangium sp. AC04546]WVK79077.1 aldo/keto reductase [Dactylosporangium sp. AC04546]